MVLKPEYCMVIFYRKNNNIITIKIIETIIERII